MRYTKTQVKRKVAELDRAVGWYQDINLGSGVHTKSRTIWGEPIDHPRQRWDFIEPAVPDNLEGLSVLDIGCNAGYFAFEAHSRGADYVLGIDTNSGYIEQARFCAEVKETDVDFRVMDIYDLDKLERTFDLVFFVGVLYHCRYLQLAVERAARVTAERLIVESAVDPSDTDIPYVRFVRSSQYEGPRGKGAARLPGHWHPNMAAMRAMFLEEGFTRVTPIFQEGGRGAVVAYRSE